ncbi:MAG: glycerol-3-phosphate acyltransferase [Promethearchaeota archaeon]
MTANVIVIAILSIIIGYILGSILPAYIIGRMKGIDIRTVGTKNAGTSNVYHVLGVKYAVMTGFYDFFKGLLAIWIAYLLQANLMIMQIAGYAAIIGHIFPFYIKFKGGQGLATSMALLITYIINFALYDLIILVFMLYVLVILITFRQACKVSNLLAILIYPLIGYAIWYYYPYYPANQFIIFTWIILGYIIVMAFYNINQFNEIKIKDELKKVWWKLFLNPSLIILLILYFYLPLLTLIILGSSSIIILLIDFNKYLNKNNEGAILRKIIPYLKESNERKHLEIALILLSIFLTMIIFNFINIRIVIAGIAFTLISIPISKFFEVTFGKRKLFLKTLEGFMGFIISILIVSFFLYTILDLSLLILLISGLSVAFFNTLPIKGNDYLKTSLLCSLLLAILYCLGL